MLYAELGRPIIIMLANSRYINLSRLSKQKYSDIVNVQLDILCQDKSFELANGRILFKNVRDIILLFLYYNSFLENLQGTSNGSLFFPVLYINEVS